MRYISVVNTLATLLSFVTFAGANAADPPPFQVPLPFKEATIQYLISGTATGTETLYIRKNGQERARYINMVQTVMGMSQQTDQIEITTPEWIYRLDQHAQSGTKALNPVKIMTEEYDKLSSTEQKIFLRNIKELGMSGLAMGQGEIQEKAATILGYDCDLTTIMGTTIYSIHRTGIPLKSEVNMMGMNFSTIATKIAEGPVADERFALPQHIEIVQDHETDAMITAQAHKMVELLKSPDAAQKMRENPMLLMPEGQHPGKSAQPSAQEMEEAEKAMEALKQLFEKQKK